MELKKAAQQELFKALARTELNTLQAPEYNGYTIDKFGYFQADLTALYGNFVAELNENLTGRSASLAVYLADIQKSIAKILKEVLQQQRTEVIEVHSNNREAFRQNKLGFINHFFNFQKEMIYKTYDEIEQKLSVVSDPKLFKPLEVPALPAGASDAEHMPKFTFKLRSNMTRKDLTVLWWLLDQCDFIEFNSQKHLADFLEQNFLFAEKDADKIHYKEMTSIQQLLSHLKKREKFDPDAAQIMIASKLRDGFEEFQEDIIEVLERQDLPGK